MVSVPVASFLGLILEMTEVCTGPVPGGTCALQDGIVDLRPLGHASVGQFIGCPLHTPPINSDVVASLGHRRDLRPAVYCLHGGSHTPGSDFVCCLGFFFLLLILSGLSYFVSHPCGYPPGPRGPAGGTAAQQRCLRLRLRHFQRINVIYSFAPKS